MDRICEKCGKTVQEAGAAFCPFCGHALPAGKAEPERNPQAARMIQKALKTGTLPERKKILEEAQRVCPDDPAIEWELLFIGTPDPKPARGKMDFSIIKSWLLQIYRKPGDFTAEKRNAMRKELFEGEQLQKVMAGSADPEGKMEEYLERLCREYIDIFLKEDNQLMGNIFGLRIGRNRDKVLEGAVENMIRQIEADRELDTGRKQMLREAMMRALRH